MPQEKDIAEKTLVGINDVFADIVNAFVFQGDVSLSQRSSRTLRPRAPSW